MTIAELERKILSVKRVKKAEQQEKDAYDYNLAHLIGVSVGRLYSNKNKFPEIESAYPNLFDTQELEEEKSKKLTEKSVANFMGFAQAFNAKHLNKEVAKKE